ncbi:MAG: AraC family transcriptional regulator [Eubacteriales bacterium]|jgi:AraC-like DNA-binding protein|nr:AraC family transcriptional regulator [Eubacteriales bacterium]
MRSYFTYPISAACLPNGFELNSFAENNLRRVYRHHHEFYELYFFLSGHAEFLMQNRAVPLGRNTLLLLPPGCSHSLRFLDEESVYQRTVLWILPELLAGVSGEDWSEPLELRLSEADGTVIGQLLLLLDGEQDRLERDFSEFEGRDTVFADYIRLIFVHMIRLREQSAVSSAFLRRTQAYLNAHLTSDLRAETIAAALHMGKTHLMRRFHAESGVSLHQYVVKLRLQRARRLLARGVGAGESAVQAGFLEYTTFYKAFLREYGLSPSRFGKGFQIAPSAAEDNRLAGRIESQA